MRTRTNYQIETTNYESSTTIIIEAITDDSDNSVYFNSDGLGCSRTQHNVAIEDAIRNWLREHGATMDAPPTAVERDTDGEWVAIDPPHVDMDDGLTGLCNDTDPDMDNGLTGL